MRIGETNCNDLRDQTQLSASILLLLRAVSLAQSSLLVLQEKRLDAFAVLQRSYWEAWVLAFEFRLKTSSKKVSRWHKQRNNHGIPEQHDVERFLERTGVENPLFCRYYGELSRDTHATKSAAEQSLLIAIASRHESFWHDNPSLPKRQAFIEEREFPMMITCLHLALTQDHVFLNKIEANMEALSAVTSFVWEYAPRINPPGNA
jgi:hypothetical protein